MAQIDTKSYYDQVWGFGYQMEDQELLFERLSPLDSINPPWTPADEKKAGKKVTRKIRNAAAGQVFN